MRSVEEIKADIAIEDEASGGMSPLLPGLWLELHHAITHGIPLDRLGAICSAEREGRCVVLPEETGIGDLSDGYHTFNELYHHRAVLFSVVCNAFATAAWKSKKHHDGTMYNGMFIVGINTPYGTATYHYDLPYWDNYHVQELEFAPECDRHTPDDAVSRLNRWARDMDFRHPFDFALRQKGATK